LEDAIGDLEVLLLLCLERVLGELGQSPPVHHTWITLESVHAIDVMLVRRARMPVHFGIPFPRAVLSRAIAQRGYGGLLDPVDRDLLGSPFGSMTGPFRDCAWNHGGGQLSARAVFLLFGPAKLAFAMSAADTRKIIHVDMDAF
jgi:hypothetical protein